MEPVFGFSIWYLVDLITSVFETFGSTIGLVLGFLGAGFSFSFGGNEYTFTVFELLFGAGFVTYFELTILKYVLDTWPG